MMTRIPLASIFAPVACILLISGVDAQETEANGISPSNTLESGATGDQRLFVDAEDYLLQLQTRASEEPFDSAGMDARLQRLRGLVSLGRADEAVEEWDSWAANDDAVKSNPDQIFWYALSLAALGQHADAVELLDNCLALQEKPHESYPYDLCIELLVSCLIETGDVESALDLAKPFIRRSRSEDLIPLMLHHLAICQQERGEADHAAETWQLLAESFPGTPEAVDADLRLQQSEEPSPSVQYRESGDEGRFSLHLGSYADQDSAWRMGQLIEELGVKVTYKDLEIPSGPLTTIVAGPFSSRNDAEQIKRFLTASLELTGAVLIGPLPDSQ